MPKPKDPVEVQELPAERTDDQVLLSMIKKFVESVKSAEPREALHLICVGEVSRSLAKDLAPFHTFPTKKVRFNVLPQSEEKLDRVAKALGTKTKKNAIDAVLEFLFNRLPIAYWDRKSEVAALLGEHLPSPGHATPVSLSMNSLGYALLQDLADILDQSQGAVLEATTALWLAELRSERAKTEQAGKIIDEFHSQAAIVEKQLQEIFDGSHIFGDESPICARFGYVMVVLENLSSSIEANMNEGVPIDPYDYSQTG